MTNPFSHDRTSNAVGDFVESATTTPDHSLSEQDYRQTAVQAAAARPGHWPNGYAP
jgi:hypothetical protein